jgi:hypothetical protein
MPLLSQPAFGPKLSIGLILGGSLIDIWTLVWRVTLGPDTLSGSERFWYLGFLLTGAILLIVGLMIGQIGRAARKAELPPAEAASAEAQIQNTAAMHPPVVQTNGMVQPNAMEMPVAAMPATPMVTPQQQVIPVPQQQPAQRVETPVMR